jgi:hypothetical protein
MRMDQHYLEGVVRTIEENRLASPLAQPKTGLTAGRPNAQAA